MRVTVQDRERLIYFLKQFYKRYPNEKHTIFHLIKWFKERLRNDRDAWVSVSGETGTGKSYFCIMGMIIGKFRNLSLENNICYVPKGDEIIEKFNKLNKNVLLIDEGAKELRAVNWQSKQQQQVNVKAMTDRYKNNLVFICMPSFRELTKSMKLSNIHFRIIVLYRNNLFARILVQRKSRNWRSDDPWYDKKAEDLYDKSMKRYGELSNKHILKIERSLPNTIMDFIIPNLELALPHVVDKYKELKVKSREIEQEITKEISKKKDKYRTKYKESMSNVAKILIDNRLNLGKMRVTRQKISEMLGVSIQTLSKWYDTPEKTDPLSAKGR